MSDEKYVDPNSGAAPQPGGWAGAQGAEKGHAVPTPEQPSQSDEDSGGGGQEYSEEERVNMKSVETQGADPEDVVVEGDDEEDEDDDMPSGNASRDDWLTYAQSREDWDEADSELGRDALRDKYGA